MFYGQTYGTLPTPTKDHYTFEGWYTEKEGGTLITENTVVQSLTDQTLYAHWSPKTFTLYFDAEGGIVSTPSKILTFGNQIGQLPTPTKDYHNFIGWYDANGNLVDEYTILISSTDLTIYAHWEIKQAISWTKASDVPVDAQILDRKYTYTKTYYTTSSSSELDGWQYDYTSYTWSEYGSWSAWTVNKIEESDFIKVEQATVYQYYFYLCPHCGAHMHGWDQCS